MKIGFVASSGGHWEELMCLKPLFNGNKCFFVTEQGGQIEEYQKDKEYTHIYIFPQMNRKEKMFLFKFISLWIHSNRILNREKPDVIITTGALISFPYCLIGKLMKIKVIYIETFARVYEASLSGKLAYHIADLFIVQWESMLNRYPNAVFTGPIF